MDDNFMKLWYMIHPKDLKQKPDWYNYEIYATLTKDVTEREGRVIHKGTKVRVWMVSRFGDVGVTDNLINPNGYIARGLDPDVDLKNYEFVKKHN